MIPPGLPRGALLAIAAAVLWGGGDFSGGMAVKRAGGTLPAALRVVLFSHFTSFCLLVAAALFRHDPLPHGAPAVWALVTGLAGGVSVLTFYIALADGAMGSAAAISGLLAATIPAIVSGATEGSPGLLPLLGFALAAGAIWLIAAGGAALRTTRRITLLAVASGTGFGIYFVSLRMASHAGFLWPLSGSRVGSMSVCLALLLAMRLRAGRAGTGREPVAITRKVIAWALATAILDTGGNVFYMSATRAGRLDIAAVLASFYPASTILLAAWLLRERPTLRQGLGMLLAAAAVVLITL